MLLPSPLRILRRSGLVGAVEIGRSSCEGSGDVSETIRQGEPKAIPAHAGKNRGRLARWAGGVFGVVLIIILGWRPALRTAAAFLIVEDPLRSASTIIVLGGDLPVREIEAARIYHAGWAPNLMLIQVGFSEQQQMLRELGVELAESMVRTREVLVRLGIPDSAIVVPEERFRGGTFEELKVAARALARDTLPVILVTSKVHTRRVRLIWNRVANGGPPGVVRAATRDPFDPSDWWRHRRDVLLVAREFLGILNHVLGYVVAQ